MSDNTSAKIQAIDAILPQTQCGLCTYGGCMPYAKAIVTEKAAIDLCPPGGVPVLEKIAELTEQDARHYISSMEKKFKPKMLAVIREDECIGCTKCIQACPVDAILGASKNMHTVIAGECTGCELCVAPCPVDCIDMVSLAKNSLHQPALEKANVARERFNARTERLEELATDKPRVRKVIPTVDSADAKKAFVMAAILRAKSKKKD